MLSWWQGVQVEDAIAFLKETGISGAARAAVTSLLGSVREAHKTPPALEVSSEAVISKVSDAWGKLVLQPPGAHAQHAAAFLKNLTGSLRRGSIPGASWCCRRWLHLLNS